MSGKKKHVLFTYYTSIKMGMARKAKNFITKCNQDGYRLKNWDINFNGERSALANYKDQVDITQANIATLETKISDTKTLKTTEKC